MTQQPYYNANIQHPQKQQWKSIKNKRCKLLNKRRYWCTSSICKCHQLSCECQPLLVTVSRDITVKSRRLSGLDRIATVLDQRTRQDKCNYRHQISIGGVSNSRFTGWEEVLGSTKAATPHVRYIAPESSGRCLKNGDFPTCALSVLLKSQGRHCDTFLLLSCR